MYNFRADLVEFWSTKVYNVFMEHKSLEVKITVSPRTGRPTDARKEFALKVRVDAKLHERIAGLCRRKKCDKSRSCEKGIR